MNLYAFSMCVYYVSHLCKSVRRTSNPNYYQMCLLSHISTTHPQSNRIHLGLNKNCDKNTSRTFSAVC